MVESICQVLLATVAEDASGIFLRMLDENNQLKIHFAPKETWGRIPENKDPRKELQIVADLLNQSITDENGDIQRKKIKVVEE